MSLTGVFQYDCCTPDQTCTNGVCCNTKRGERDCGGVCCGPGRECSLDQCCGPGICPPGDSCCCGKFCCPAGYFCCGDCHGCCPNGTSCINLLGIHFCL